MYLLTVSSNKDDFKGVCLVKPKEYLLVDVKEVCKVISSLSHLSPVITMCQLPVLSADDVLKDFEPKQV